MSRRLYPRRPGFYDTVFSQLSFWAVVVVIFIVLYLWGWS